MPQRSALRSAGARSAKGIPDPRPLYRLPQLIASPEKPVLVVEGEKKTAPAELLFPDHAATAAMGGGKAPQKTDFGPLAGRDVVIWPDHDEMGNAFAVTAAQLARDA